MAKNKKITSKKEDRQQKEPVSSKNSYKLKSRTLGTMYVSFSGHAYERMQERQVNLITVLASLTQAADKLYPFRNKGEVLLIDTDKEQSIVLGVSQTEKNILYFNLITIIDTIPLTEDGQLRFHQIDHFVTI